MRTNCAMHSNRGSKTVEAWPEKIDTVASGIADPLIGYPEDGTTTLNVIRKSAGVSNYGR